MVPALWGAFRLNRLNRLHRLNRLNPSDFCQIPVRLWQAGSLLWPQAGRTFKIINHQDH